MEIRFDGKRALVTGAGKGIGRRVALKLAECGAEVIAISRTQSDLDKLSQQHEKIQTILLDIGQWEATKSVIETIGTIDLLVNNAGIVKAKEFGDITEEEIDELYNINIKAIMNITQIVGKGMKERGHGGSIVNVSSICGFRVSHYMAVYASSKAAVDQLTRCMATEYGPYKIRVNSVNPTGVRTTLPPAEVIEAYKDLGPRMVSRTPLGRLGEIDEVVYPILFLLSDKASLINGVILPIDGGLTNCI